MLAIGQCIRTRRERKLWKRRQLTANTAMAAKRSKFARSFAVALFVLLIVTIKYAVIGRVMIGRANFAIAKTLGAIW
jgi:hypothetical protein